MPNGIIKMLYSGTEDKKFTKNPDIKYFRSVFKSYSNFIRISEKMGEEINYNINTTSNFDIILTNNNYDLLGELYLYIKLTKSIDNNILDFIRKIDFYVSDILIDSLTPDIMKLYNDIYYDESRYKIYDLLTKNTNMNTYFIPLHFHFLHKSSSYVPLYLLRNEIIRVKIYFDKILDNTVFAEDIILTGNYFILENQDRRKLETNYWFVESINYMENIELDVSVRGDMLNRIDLLFQDYCKSLLFIFKNCNVNNIKVYIDNLRLNYSVEHLKYINFLQTNVKNNTIINTNDNTEILLMPFSLFKSELSGYINLKSMNGFYIEVSPFSIHTTIHFNITSVFTDYYFYVTTDLLTSEVNQSPDIIIYTKINYKLSMSNCDIIITTEDPAPYLEEGLEIPDVFYYSGFNYLDKTLIVDNLDIYSTLYYCHKTSINNNLMINRGKIILLPDSKVNSGVGGMNIYSINYNLYTIKGGQLTSTDFNF